MTTNTSDATASASVNQLIGTPDQDFIFGTTGNDNISALAGNDTIYLSKGNDTIDGGEVTDKILADFLGQPFRYRPFSQKIEGEGFTSQLSNIEQIGERRLPLTNTLDFSDVDASQAIETNLTGQGLAQIAKIGNVASPIELYGFANVIGGAGNDTIQGGFSTTAKRLEGGAGNDTIDGGKFPSSDTLIGGSGDDILRGLTEVFYNPRTGNPISGTDRPAQVDTLTGGEGNDVFVIGEEDKGYYIGDFTSSSGAPSGSNIEGRDLYAKITDLSGGDQIRLNSGSYITISNPDGTLTLAQQFFFGSRSPRFDLAAEITFGGALAPAANAQNALLSSAKVSSSTTDSTGAVENSFTIAPGEQIGFFVGV